MSEGEHGLGLGLLPAPPQRGRQLAVDGAGDGIGPQACFVKKMWLMFFSLLLLVSCVDHLKCTHVETHAGALSGSRKIRSGAATSERNMFVQSKIYISQKKLFT